MTQRQKIIMMLTAEALSLKDLAEMLPAKPDEVLDDLAHISRSIRPKGKLIVTPATCRKCQFTFRDTGKLKTPSGCPKCRSTWIQAPVFRIEGKPD